MFYTFTLTKIYAVSIEKNRLNSTNLLSTQKNCIRKYPNLRTKYLFTKRYTAQYGNTNLHRDQGVGEEPFFSHNVHHNNPQYSNTRSL